MFGNMRAMIHLENLQGSFLDLVIARVEDWVLSLCSLFFGKDGPDLLVETLRFKGHLSTCCEV